jgi:hypothetical protein
MKGQWKPKDQYKKSFENTKYELKIRFVDLDQRFLKLSSSVLFPPDSSLHDSDYEPAEDRADEVAHEGQKGCRELPGKILGIIVKSLTLELEQLL